MLNRIERAKSTIIPGIAIDQSLLQTQHSDRIESSLQSLHTSAYASQQQVLRLLQERSECIPAGTCADKLDPTLMAAVSQDFDRLPLQQSDHSLVKGPTVQSQPRHTSKGAIVRRTYISRWWSVFGSFETAHHDQSRADGDHPSATSSRYRLLFPPWLLNLSIALITQRSFGSVSACLETQRLVPACAEIFRLCATGDIVGTQKLIAAGKASVHDASYEGVTPLAIAAAYRQADTCRFLPFPAKRWFGS